MYMQAEEEYDTKKTGGNKKKGDIRVKVDRQGGKGVKQLKGDDGGLLCTQVRLTVTQN